MVKIEYDFDTEGIQHDAPFLDPYEVGLMFEQTKRSLGQALERKLGNMSCDEHGAEPTVRLVGRYNQEREELDVHYDIDTCCKLFMVRVVKLLNAAS
jgi:hypothetical protein